MIALKDARATAELRPPEAAKPLKNRVFRAGGWTLVGHFVTLALRLFSSIILTRIFTPETFGVLAIITAVGTLIGLLTDIGLRQAVVQSRRGENAVFLNTAWSVQVIRGVVVWGLCAVVAACLYFASRANFLPRDSVYAQPALPQLILISCLSSIITGFQSTKLYTAARDLRLGRVTLIELFSFVGGLAFVIPFGLLTRSIWAYVIGLLLTSVVSVALSHLWLQGPANRFAWDKEALRELGHFGRWIFFSSAVSATILNGDRMLLAGLFNPMELGFYSIANNLANVPDALASKLFGSVALPTLSEVNRSQPQRFSALLSRIRWLSDSLLLLVAGFLFASGETIVHTLYDARYAPAGWMLQWLSFSLVFARYNIAGTSYVALGRPQYLTAIAVIRSISLFAFLGFGYWMFGVPGAIIGIAFHMVPNAISIIYFNWRLGIADFWLETLVPMAWLGGWLVGTGLNRLLLVLALHAYR